ncbi:MAG: type II secretion system protein [bacterium]|nr:type II secretion system protein [bacterium]
MPHRNRCRGMTLIEALVWIAVFVMVMLALTTSVLYFYRTSNYAIQQASAISSAQRGIEALMKIVREASYASNGAYPVAEIATSSLTFYADADSDAAIERVHYYLQNNTLMKGVLDPSGDPPAYSGAEATSTISENLRNTALGVSLFTYYNKSGVQISDYTRIADVRFVSVVIYVDVDPGKTPTPIFLRSSAAMRNLVGK